MQRQFSRVHLAVLVAVVAGFVAIICAMVYIFGSCLQKNIVGSCGIDLLFLGIFGRTANIRDALILAGIFVAALIILWGIIAVGLIRRQSRHSQKR